MGYLVKELYHTLQGEGAHTGRAAVFCRFAGCNLWSGLERDREDAQCRFCDTDFRGTDGPGGGRFPDAEALARAIREVWDDATEEGGRPYVVFTGGEPLLQLDAALVQACHALGLEVGVETNGTRLPPPGIDWICVSPKAGAPWVLRAGHELKLVYPQPGLLPDQLGELAFDHCFLQPMDGPSRDEHTAAAARWCQRHPRWRLSLQTHKLIGLP